jgi:hypothetical protein
MATLIGTSRAVVVGTGETGCSGTLDSFSRTTPTASVWNANTTAVFSPTSRGMAITNEYYSDSASARCNGSSLVVTQTSNAYGSGVEWTVESARWPWAGLGPFTVTARIFSSTAGFSFGVKPSAWAGIGGYGVYGVGAAGSSLQDGAGHLASGGSSHWADGIWLRVKWQVRPGSLMRAVVWHDGSAQPGAWDVTLTGIGGGPVAQFTYGIGLNTPAGNYAMIDWISVDFG